MEFNPVPLGGKTIYTSLIGIILGGILMLSVGGYAVGKFSVIQS
jgi:hypothetical protein